jgi:PAS domain-containing protein
LNFTFYLLPYGGNLSKRKDPTSTFNDIKSEILDSIDSFVYTKDLSGKYTYANQALLDLFEKKLTDVIGYDDSHFFDLAISRQLKINDDLVMNKAIRVESEEKNFIKAKNETRIYKVVKKPLYNIGGSVDGMSGMSTDITV